MFLRLFFLPLQFPVFLLLTAVCSLFDTFFSSGALFSQKSVLFCGRDSCSFEGDWNSWQLLANTSFCQRISSVSGFSRVLKATLNGKGNSQSTRPVPCPVLSIFSLVLSCKSVFSPDALYIIVFLDNVYNDLFVCLCVLLLCGCQWYVSRM